MCYNIWCPNGLSMHMHIFFWHIVHVHVLYTSSCRKHHQCHSWYDGEFVKESTVQHLVDQKQIHCNRAVQFTPSKWKRSSCQQSKSTLVLAVIRKVEVWKSALSPVGPWTSEEDGECIRLLCECSPKKTNTQRSLSWVYLK